MHRYTNPRLVYLCWMCMQCPICLHSLYLWWWDKNCIALLCAPNFWASIQLIALPFICTKHTYHSSSDRRALSTHLSDQWQRPINYDPLACHMQVGHKLSIISNTSKSFKHWISAALNVSYNIIKLYMYKLLYTIYMHDPWSAYIAVPHSPVTKLSVSHEKSSSVA